jgi:hypothetical protein
MAIAGVIVFFLFFMSLGGDNSANDETQNMGQAHHATTAIDIPGSAGDTSGGPTTRGYNGGGTMTGGYNSGAPTTGGYNGGGTTTGGYYNGGNGNGADDLEEVVDEAVGDIQQAEEEQLEQSAGMLSSALSSIGNVSNVFIHFSSSSSCRRWWWRFLLLPLEPRAVSNIRYYLHAFSVSPYWYGQDARK